MTVNVTEYEQLKNKFMATGLYSPIYNFFYLNLLKNSDQSSTPVLLDQIQQHLIYLSEFFHEDNQNKIIGNTKILKKAALAKNVGSYLEGIMEEMRNRTEVEKLENQEKKLRYELEKMPTETQTHKAEISATKYMIREFVDMAFGIDSMNRMSTSEVLYKKE